MLGTSCEILTDPSCEAHIGSNINQSENDSHCFIESQSTQIFEFYNFSNNIWSLGSISLHASDVIEHYHNNNSTDNDEYPWITLYVSRVTWNILVYYIDTQDGLKTICNIELTCNFNIWEANSGNFRSCNNLDATLQHDTRQSVCENDSISVRIPSHAMNQSIVINQTDVMFKINMSNYCMGKYHTV